jgi:hypothetical protein
MNKGLMICATFGLWLLVATFPSAQMPVMKKDCIIVIGGGYDYPEVNVSVAEQNTLEFCQLLRTAYDVVCLDNFTFPSYKSTLDVVIANLSMRARNLYAFGISAGAIPILAVAQESKLFKSAVVCSAPVDYDPWNVKKPEWYWHLADTANCTKIPLLFVMPSEGDSFSERQNVTFCEQMQTYYNRDPVSPKQIVMWNVSHNPLDNNPAELCRVAEAWYKMSGGD